MKLIDRIRIALGFGTLVDGDFTTCVPAGFTQDGRCCDYLHTYEYADGYVLGYVLEHLAPHWEQYDARGAWRFAPDGSITRDL